MAMKLKKLAYLICYLCSMSPCPCDILNCFNYDMRYALQARWRSVGGLFFMPLCSYIPGIFRTVYVHQSRQKGIVQYAQPERACIMQSVQFPTFQAISIFSQIQLDGFNCHIFPPCFTQMKWKIEGSSGHKRERTLQFFTFFPAIYSTYNGFARKNRAGFSHVRVCGLQHHHFPRQICAYI